MKQGGRVQNTDMFCTTLNATRESETSLNCLKRRLKESLKRYEKEENKEKISDIAEKKERK